MLNIFSPISICNNLNNRDKITSFQVLLSGLKKYSPTASDISLGIKTQAVKNKVLK